MKNTLFIFFLCGWISVVQAAETTQQQFEHIIQTALQQTFHQTKQDSLKLINVQASGAVKDELDFLIENEIFQFAKANQISIFQDSLKTEMAQLQYQAISHAVDVEKIGKENYKRTVSAELYFRLVSPHKEILFSEIITNALVDTLSHQELKLIENKELNFTIAAKKESSIIEPIIISVVTGVIVYIFYSYRSK